METLPVLNYILRIVSATERLHLFSRKLGVIGGVQSNRDKSLTTSR